jgi:hypothetical protein
MLWSRVQLAAGLLGLMNQAPAAESTSARFQSQQRCLGNPDCPQSMDKLQCSLTHVVLQTMAPQTATRHTSSAMLACCQKSALGRAVHDCRSAATRLYRKVMIAVLFLVVYIVAHNFCVCNTIAIACQQPHDSIAVLSLCKHRSHLLLSNACV